MKKLSTDWRLIFLIFGLLFIANPLYAALQPHTFSGNVSALDAGSNRIEIQTESGAFAGEAPNEHAFDGLSRGDAVIAVSLGKKGGKWVFIGRIKATEKILTDGYGDISFIQTENCSDESGDGIFCDVIIAGQFQFRYANTPDCNNCSGCNCKALQTTVTITDPANQETAKTLLPGESFAYEGREYTIKMIFIAGEAAAYPECSAQMCAGPQPVSNFVMHIAPNNSETKDDGGGHHSSSSSCFIFTALLSRPCKITVR